VQQMTIDMQEIGIIANLSDDMLVPDFGQHRTAGLFQSMSSLCCLLGPQLLPLTAVLQGLCLGLNLPVSKHSRPLFG
jgi:hypothetical protein